MLLCVYLRSVRPIQHTVLVSPKYDSGHRDYTLFVTSGNFTNSFELMLDIRKSTMKSSLVNAVLTALITQYYQGKSTSHKDFFVTPLNSIEVWDKAHFAAKAYMQKMKVVLFLQDMY